MSGESPKKIGRGYERNLDAGQFQPMIDSWDLHLRAEKKSAKTIPTYLEAAQWFAAEHLIPGGFTDWDGVRAKQVQEWTITLLGRYSDSYANNQFRALQQFFRWHSTEDPDEQRPNPMVGLKPPKIGEKLVPVFTDDELAALLGTCKGGGFQNRRDYAIISVFKDTGARLSELAGLTTDDISPATARPSSQARATSSARSGSPTTRPARSTATNASAPSTKWPGRGRCGWECAAAR
jgi:integrase/recombinase XerD